MNKKISKLILELNSNCNNNCIYCYIPENARFNETKCDEDFFKKELLKYKNINNVDFTGGEPTLSSHLFKLIRFSKKIGYQNRTLVTNGRMLAYKEYCRKLVDAGITRIVIPLDGPNKEIAESITRAPGSFEQVISAMKNIKDLNIEMGTTIVVNKLNYKFISETIKKCIDLGADFINIQFLLPFVEDKRVVCQKIPLSIIPSYKESVKYLKETLDKYGDKNKINVNFIPFCYMKGYETYLEEDSFKFDREIINYQGYSYNMGEHLEKGSIKTEECNSCKYKKECCGFFHSYANELGILNNNFTNPQNTIKKILDDEN